MSLEHFTDHDRIESAVLGFCEFCRGHELTIGLNHTEEALLAAKSGFINHPESLKYALRTLFCTNPEEYETFNRLFEAYWRKKSHEYAPRTRIKNQTNMVKQSKGSVVLMGSGESEGKNKEEAKKVTGANKQESLRKTDFSKVSEIDHDLLDRLAEKLLQQLNHRLRRRLRVSRKGKIDLRKTIRQNLAHGDTFIELFKKDRRLEKHRLVVLLDVSGSMDKYSFYLLKFIWNLKSSFKNVEAFIFSTKLVRITDFMDKRQIDEALLSMSAHADNWSSGTTIGKCLKSFNDEYAPLVLNGRSLTIVLSDGLDTGEPGLLSSELRKIKLRTKRLIWLNPLKGMEGYEPLTKGMMAALLEIDTFESAHSLDSLMELEKYLSHV